MWPLPVKVVSASRTTTHRRSNLRSKSNSPRLPHACLVGVLMPSSAKFSCRMVPTSAARLAARHGALNMVAARGPSAARQSDGYIDADTLRAIKRVNQRLEGGEEIV